MGASGNEHWVERQEGLQEEVAAEAKEVSVPRRGKWSSVANSIERSRNLMEPDCERSTC